MLLTSSPLFLIRFNHQDIRHASANRTCLHSEYQNTSSILGLSRAPVFIILGDNDWYVLEFPYQLLFSVPALAGHQYR